MMNDNQHKQTIREKAEAQVSSSISQASQIVQTLSLEETRNILHEFEVHQIELKLQNEELIATSAELKKAQKRYFDLYDMAPIGYCTISSDGLIQEVNFALTNLLCESRNSLIGQPLSHFISNEDQDIFYIFKKNLLKTQEQQECELKMQCLNKTPFWAYLTADTNDDAVRLVVKDISKRKKTEEKLELLASVFKTAGEGIMITDTNGYIIDVNKAFCTITGYSKEEVINKKTSILNSGIQSLDYYKKLWDTLIQNGSWSGEIWNKTKNGDMIAELLIINTVYDDHDKAKYFVALFSDISNIKEYEKSLKDMVNYDQLTKLPNRVLLADRLLNNMSQTKRNNKNLAVVFLDLDEFKDVNDSYGHHVGDALLIKLANEMKKALREGDTISRIGGDEFVALLVNLDNISAALPIINRLREAAMKVVQIDKMQIQVSASLGVTFYPQLDEMVDADQLIRQADQAMYKAKVTGKNMYYVFDTEKHQFISDRFDSIARLKDALQNEEFQLYYQPKVNMCTGEIIGLEALIRWNHPSKGLIAPLDFLPIIEGNDLVLDLGKWVIKSAVMQLKTFQEMEINIPISVNVSAQELLDEGFVEYLENIFIECKKVNPEMLEIEVLESSKLDDLDKAIKVMNACKKIGISFSLDDFGTGYSSLTYLKRLPIKYIKIDQSFVKDMLDSHNDLSILQGIISLAKSFKYQVIAEGVETQEHGVTLLKLGCCLAQGYSISKPMPIAKFNDWFNGYTPNVIWKNAVQNS